VPSLRGALAALEPALPLYRMGAQTSAVTRAMGSLLFGVGPADPVSFLSVTAILFGVAGAAASIPAATASRISPLVAIRGE
jgi:hypothetical protein